MSARTKISFEFVVILHLIKIKCKLCQVTENLSQRGKALSPSPGISQTASLRKNPLGKTANGANGKLLASYWRVPRQHHLLVYSSFFGTQNISVAPQAFRPVTSFPFHLPHHPDHLSIHIYLLLLFFSSSSFLFYFLSLNSGELFLPTISRKPRLMKACWGQVQSHENVRLFIVDGEFNIPSNLLRLKACLN